MRGIGRHGDAGRWLDLQRVTSELSLKDPAAGADVAEMATSITYSRH
ncbi:MAG: hypothetical protein HOH36_07885 [Acidimicrobiaceae bacterium]|mgnify:CR=1 FL=1|nr:hypothetical protein [Acidimicrobiaceae bacterium]MBT5580500.1 hypothetical protein [Acidimicrobiaceae bacterium]MBT5850336.1 hypothetical protein [Acidimicrobiaceae bacterium]